MSSQEKHLKEGGKQDEAEKVRQMCGFRSLALSWTIGDLWKVFDYTKLFQPRGKWSGLLGSHFNQPFAAGHLQRSAGAIISQTSLVEVVPTSQGQTYTEGLPLAINTCAAERMNTHSGQGDLDRAPRVSTIGIKGEKSYTHDIF